MSFDRKLRKTIEKDCETPELSFEDWAEKHNIKLNMPVETNKVKQEHVHVGGGVYAMRAGISSVVLVLIIAAILLPVLLSTLLSTAPLKFYKSTEIVSNYSDFEEMSSVEDIYIFKTSGDDIQIQMGTVLSDYSNDEEHILLGYFINDCLIGVGQDAFYLGYHAVIYPNYEFINHEQYNSLSKKTVVHGKEINYDIRQSTSIVGYANFKVGDYSYYLSAEGFEDITPNVTEENFLELLDAILK